jgi:hypothetical protein
LSTNINDNLQVQAGEGLWIPPPAVKDHQGSVLAPECDFFVRPPREIGEVRSAHTSLKKGVSAKPTPTRIAFTAVWGAAGFLLALGIQRLSYLFLIPAGMTHTPVWIWEALFACLPAYIGWRKTAFGHFCEFVGAEGCAQIKCEGARDHILQNSIFCFKNAESVSTSLVRHIKNGRYQYTNFYFYWYPPDNEKAIYQIDGSHSADAKTPPAGNPYNFARAAESAWYDFVIPKIDEELARNGFIKFNMGRNRWTRVGRGFIEIVDKSGKVSRCDADDIGSAKLEGGYLTICAKGAKASRFDLFSKEGVFRYDYAAMHNARLFLVAFEKFLNIKVE